MPHQFLCWAGKMLVGTVVLCGLLGDASLAQAYTMPEPRSGHAAIAHSLQNAPERPAPIDVDLVPVFGADIAGLRYQGNSAALSVIANPESIPGDGDRRSLALRATPKASRSESTSGAGNGSSPEVGVAGLEIDLEPEFPHAFVFVTWRLFTAYEPTSSQGEFPSTFFVDVEDQSTQRNLVSVTSGDARLLPASQVLAAGAAFDYFSSNEELELLQLSSQARAGLTELRTSGFLVDGNGPITIRLAIAHGNGNPAGTMVVIDRIELTSMLPAQLQQGGSDCVTFQENCSNLFPVPGTFLDPGFPERPPRFCELQADGQGQDLDLQEPLEFRGTIITTVIADGEIRIPLGGFISDEPREEFEISFFEGTAPEDGGFSEFGSFDRLPVVTVPTFSYQGQTVGLAQFLVPETFVTDSLDLETEYGPARRVRLDFCFQNSGGLDRTCFMPPPVEIRRPPVVLVHGIWSEAATWNDFDLRTSEFLDVRVADYSGSNASSFEENRSVPAHMLSDLCGRYERQGWFFTQADVVGHSMGGLLAREYLAYAAPFTTINRLYTLNTPHSGSELANLVRSVREHPNARIRQAFIAAMASRQKPVDQGAIDDLSVGSSALSSLLTTQVLSHALVGVGGSSFQGPGLVQAPGTLGVIYKLAATYVDLGDLFESLQHDLVVRRPSQIGGLPLGTFTVFDGPNSTHTQVTSSQEYSERILCPGSENTSNGSCERGSGLASSTGTGEFSFFPAALASHVRVSAPTVSESVDLNEDDEGGLNITSPSEGDIFQSGDSVVVTAEPVPGRSVEAVVLVSKFDVAEMTGSPLAATVDIPIEFVGRFEVGAFGRDGKGGFPFSNPVELNVEAPAELLGLTVNPDIVFLRGPTDTRNIWVVGQFSDGVDRTMTSHSATYFTSLDTSVAEVTSEGKVIPQGVGTTTIVVQNGEISGTMTVEVLSFDLGNIFRDRFESLASIIGLWGFRTGSDNP